MKIAYLVFAYKNPLLLRRLIEFLSCNASAFFVHIDAKSDLNLFASIKADNIYFSEQRIPVYWAEFSGIQAISILIRQALVSPQSYDYFVLLSGSEYPLRDRAYIHKFFERARGTEFMTIVNMPNLAAGKPISRVDTVRIPSDRPAFRFIFRALAKLGLARRDHTKYLGDLQPYAGNTWWALTRRACEYIIDYEASNPHVATFFRDTFAPEEMYFHTILGNSPFRFRMRRNLVFEDWQDRGARPAMIDEKHIAFFEAQREVFVNDLHGPGELLFARKFSDANIELVQRMDEMIRRKSHTAG